MREREKVTTLDKLNLQYNRYTVIQAYSEGAPETCRLILALDSPRKTASFSEYKGTVTQRRAGHEIREDLEKRAACHLPLLFSKNS